MGASFLPQGEDALQVTGSSILTFTQGETLCKEIGSYKLVTSESRVERRGTQRERQQARHRGALRTSWYTSVNSALDILRQLWSDGEHWSRPGRINKDQVMSGSSFPCWKLHATVSRNASKVQEWLQEWGDKWGKIRLSVALASENSYNRDKKLSKYIKFHQQNPSTKS